MLSSFWPGRTGPLLGPKSPHVGAETDPSPRPLHCDWAYKPGGGKGEGEGGWQGAQEDGRKNGMEGKGRDANGGTQDKVVN